MYIFLYSNDNNNENDTSILHDDNRSNNKLLQMITFHEGNRFAVDPWSGLSLPSGFRRKGGEVGAGGGTPRNQRTLAMLEFRVT